MDTALTIAGYTFDEGAGHPMTERLLRAAEEIWEGYHSHPFVRGIADGSLAQDKFVFYMLQDYVYLIDYARVFAIAGLCLSD